MLYPLSYEGGGCADCCAGSKKSYRTALLVARDGRPCALEAAAAAFGPQWTRAHGPGPPWGRLQAAGRLRGYRDRLGRGGRDALVVRGPSP